MVIREQRSEPTYDIMGLTQAQMVFLRGLLGAYTLKNIEDARSMGWELNRNTGEELYQEFKKVMPLKHVR